MDGLATWTIENFSLLPQRKREVIESPPICISFFKTPFRNQCSLTIVLYPRGEYFDSISCKVKFKQRTKKYISESDISIIDDEGSPFITKQISHGFVVAFCKCSKLLRNKETLLPNDTLTLRIYLKMKVPPKLFINMPLLSENLMMLYDSKNHSDVVHKFILKSRAREFWQQLQSASSRQVRFEVKNTSAEALENYLKFIYKGFLEEDPNETCFKIYDFLDDLNLKKSKEKFLQSSCITSISTTVKCHKNKIDFVIEDLESIKEGTQYLMCKSVVELEFLRFSPVLLRTSSSNFEIILMHLRLKGNNIFLVTNLSVSGKILHKSFNKYYENWFKEGADQHSFSFFMITNDLSELDDSSGAQVNITLEVAVSDGTATNKTHLIFPETTCEILNSNSAFCYLKDLAFNGSDDFPDVTIQIEGQKIFAHRAMLSLRSPVFEGMFRNDSTESKTGIISIVDYNYSTICKLLEYMYTGYLSLDLGLQEIISLYKASDKYMVLTLRQACAQTLSTVLTVENCSCILQMSDMYDDIDLMDTVKDFICEQWAHVKTTEDWKELVKTNISLAYGVTQCLLDKHYKE